MKQLIEYRLEASLKMDVINGDSFEKSVFQSQIKEAIAELKFLRGQVRSLSAQLED